MSNNPYPSNRAIARGAIVEHLMAAQNSDVEKFKAATAAFYTIFQTIEFPLGCPVDGYDLEDIRASIEDWLLARPATDIEAWDAAEDWEPGPDPDAAQDRRIDDEMARGK